MSVQLRPSAHQIRIKVKDTRSRVVKFNISLKTDLSDKRNDEILKNLLSDRVLNSLITVEFQVFDFAEGAGLVLAVLDGVVFPPKADPPLGEAEGGVDFGAEAADCLRSAEKKRIRSPLKNKLSLRRGPLRCF